MPLYCPSCSTTSLNRGYSKLGVEIDYCSNCRGVWFDKGELPQFASSPQRTAAVLGEAIKGSIHGNLISPRDDDTLMDFVVYPNGPQLNYCPVSQGIWLSAEAFQRLEESSEITLNLEEIVRNSTQKGSDDEPRIRLPNLWLQSVLTFVLLYGMLFLAVFVATVVADVGTVTFTMLMAVVLSLIGFGVAPLMLDLVLRFAYSSEKQPLSELPPHLCEFLQNLFQQHDLKISTITVIQDSAPEAFTYGHIQSNARIVISRGLIEILEPDELEAVLAHEVGHIVRWDFMLMTFAQMVPTTLMLIYLALRGLALAVSKKGRAAVLLVSWIVYLLYIVSNFIVLGFSRIRELYADQFSAAQIPRPRALSLALIKIGYGLLGKTENASSSNSNSGDISPTLGIYASGDANVYALAKSDSETSEGESISPQSIAEVARWEAWNPWARVYELTSTHPRIARRLKHLDQIAQSKDQPPLLPPFGKKPEYYWDDFLVDLVIWLLPKVAFFVGLYFMFMAIAKEDISELGVGLVAYGAARILNFAFRYRRSSFDAYTIAALLKRVKVSEIRPVPCQVTGSIIGRGTPGFALSEDFVLRDATGIMYLDVRQPLAIWEWLFAFLKGDKYIGKEVTIRGWYRRSSTPYIEISEMYLDGESLKSWAWRVSYVLNWLLFSAGTLLLVL